MISVIAGRRVEKFYSTNDRVFDFEAAVLKIGLVRTGRTDSRPALPGGGAGPPGGLPTKNASDRENSRGRGAKR